MARAGLTSRTVVDLALAVADEQGAAAVTLAAVAQRAGVATPALYKHVANLAELRLLVSERVLQELADRLAAAVLGRSGDDAVRSLLRAYRGYVVAHPGRYGAMLQRPVDDPRWREAGERLTEVVLAVLRGYGPSAPDLVHAARTLRAAAHGFAVLEAAGGFGLPEDVDASYEMLIDTVIGGIRARTGIGPAWGRGDHLPSEG